MILFYKQDAQEFTAEKLILETSFPDEVKFAEKICGREEVIVVDDVENVLEAVQSKPTARIVLIADDIYALNPSEILELGKKGVSKFANRGDVNDLTEKVSEAYAEKKNLASYIHQEVPTILMGKDHKLQVDGLLNNYIVGKSDETVKILQVIKTFSIYKEDILVRGEHGSGKEIFVKTLLDNLSGAKGVPGIMNLGEVSQQLFASELFGHLKGTFTGADKNKEGMLSTYNGGVLYLDEIGELPMEAQAMLLRVLQNRQYRPVGSAETRTFDIQIVMATNRPLEKMISDGMFREDLFNRMKKMVVNIPPLRARKEDIPLLAEVFLSEINLKYPARPRKIASNAMNLLSELEWPGNIRELENFIFRAHLHESSSTISLDTIIRTIRNDESPKLNGAVSNIERLESLAVKFNLDFSKSILSDPASVQHQAQQMYK